MPIKQNSIQVVFEDFYPISNNLKNYTLVLSKANQYFSDIIDISSQPRGGNGFKLNISYQGYNADVSIFPQHEVDLYKYLTLLYHEYERAPITTFFRLPVNSAALTLAVSGQEQMTVRNFKSVILLILTAASTNNILLKDEFQDLDKVLLRMTSLERALDFIKIVTSISSEAQELVIPPDSKNNSLYATIQKLKIKIQTVLNLYSDRKRELEQSQFTTKILRGLNEVSSNMTNLEGYYKDALKVRQINSDEIVQGGTFIDSRTQIDYYWSTLSTCASKLESKDEFNSFFSSQYPELYFSTNYEKIILFMLNNTKDSRVVSNLDKRELKAVSRVNDIISSHLGLTSNLEKATFIAMFLFKFDLTEEQFMAVTRSKMFFPEKIIEKIQAYSNTTQFSGQVYCSNLKDSMMIFYRLFVTRYKKLQTIASLTEKLLHSVGVLGVIKLKTAINDVFLTKLSEFLNQISQISDSIIKQLSTGCCDFNSKQDKIRVELYKKLFGDLFLQVNVILKNIKELNLIYNTDKVIVKVQQEATSNLDNFMSAVNDLLEKDGDFRVNHDLREKLQEEKEILSSEIQGTKGKSSSAEGVVVFSCKGF